MAAVICSNRKPPSYCFAMLTISDKQMGVFRTALKDSLESRLYQHACSRYPESLRAFGADCIRTLVRLAIDKAGDYALVSEEANRLFLRLILECGIGFDSDPVLDFLVPALKSRYAERKRVVELAVAADQYSAKTAPGLRDAALRFQKFRIAWPNGADQEVHLRSLCSSCIALFPEKAELVPEGAWLPMHQRATGAATELGWRTHTAHAVLFALFFLTGPGLLADPRFAFIPLLEVAATEDPGVVLHRTAANEFERWFTRMDK